MLSLKEITMLLRPFAFAAALLTLGMTAAHADASASTNVAFGDLNLSNPADAKVLADRLQGAAKEVCLKANPEIGSQAVMQDCIDSAIAMAMGRIETRMDENVRANLVNVRTSMATP
jgi:UrcA family protein